MKKDKQIKLFALALALMIAVVGTIMILGIQVSFNQSDEGAKITAPIIVVGLVALLFIYKLIRKQTKTNFVLRMTEGKGKKLGPYFTIGFTFFDYMLLCAILSVLCGIASGVLSSVYETIRIDALVNWSYTVGRMAIVFALYILCFLIYTFGNMIAYAVREKNLKNATGGETNERV